MVSLVQRPVAGRNLSLETGRLAQQANGSVLVRYGDTVVLVTVCAASETVGGMDFVPLTVDYEEKLYAAGKIPGSFIRREGRPSEDATLVARLVDRCLRPLLSKRFGRETQVVATVLSADKENNPDTCALVGASAALSISEIPFAGPVSAVHVGYIDGQLVLNPGMAAMADSRLNIVVGSTRDAVVMVEAGASEITEETMLEAIQFGHKANLDIIALQDEFQAKCGRSKLAVTPYEPPADLVAAVSDALAAKLRSALEEPDKAARAAALDGIRAQVTTAWAEKYPDEEVVYVYESQLRKHVRRHILRTRQHVDGRRYDEIRPITTEVGVLPCTHGSGLFTRGQTQALTITTLGSERQEQLLDGLGLAETKRFMHHYNFPPFSTGEVRRLRMPGRREIGHGALVERAISPVLPSEEEFPYTVRLVSEILSSNGSSSMASVCGSTLSLMDAGVPIKAPVAGIAMGVINGDDGAYVVLTDIEGMEDALGDMDFKVAGTAKGITALQLDIKMVGIAPRILGEAMVQAHDARLFILAKMAETIGQSRAELSPYAPRVLELKIDIEKIGALIGPGGRNIRAIIEETKTTIDVKNDGRVMIGSPSEEATRKAVKMVEDLTREAKIGEVYTGKVTRVFDFGAMVEILPGKEGLVHISELADHRVPTVQDEVQVGDEVTVKVIEIDSLGRINLSRRAAFAGASDSSESRRSGPPSSRPPRQGPPSRPPHPRPQDRPRGFSGHDS
ncbi:MAG: polyribonucleotide nucleotidyltransferase [Dehalococcoidia bacterium]|jgi:polyribonucleotide nucleotidyltransferase|nr:polyribonucleotide nucleotidyltransferase [Dehalococcoidia bacterium]